jgi:cytochrome c-type biogenesis protein CcmH/NrfG
MLNSKNIHIALLGIILGSAFAYVYGSYRLESRRQLEAETLAGSPRAEVAPDHPEITDQTMLAFFTEALAANPNNPELLSRYADYLFDLGRYTESSEIFSQALKITPEDVAVRTAMATAMYGSGRVEDAILEFQRALESDATYVLALHNLALAYLDGRNDVVSAQTALRQIELIEPTYAGIASIRERIAAAGGNTVTP